MALAEKGKSVVLRKMFEKMRMIDSAKNTIRKRYAFLNIVLYNTGPTGIEIDVHPCREIPLATSYV